MGYPPQPPQEPYPYGQQPPSQPYGYSGPQQPGYGFQPPAPPPPRRSNTALILVLAIGIPLLLLGGCAAVVLVLADSGGRERIVTEADAPSVVVSTRAPESGAPTVQQETAATEPPAQQEQSTASVGGSITLQGTDPGLAVKVTVVKVVNPATPAQDFMKPKSGNKFVALEVTLENVGQAVYSDAPTNGAMLIDGEGQQFRSTLYDVREGQSLNGTATINVGDSRKGVIVFEVPESAKLVKLQFALNSGFADQKGEWTLS